MPFVARGVNWGQTMPGPPDYTPVLVARVRKRMKLELSDERLMVLMRQIDRGVIGTAMYLRVEFPEVLEGDARRVLLQIKRLLRQDWQRIVAGLSEPAKISQATVRQVLQRCRTVNPGYTVGNAEFLIRQILAGDIQTQEELMERYGFIREAAVLVFDAVYGEVLSRLPTEAQASVS